MKTYSISLFIKTIQWTGIVIFAWSLGFWFNRYFPSPDAEWLKFLYEKKQAMLTQNTSKPRLIIMGGSGTFFGIDSELMEQRLKMTVINAGMHAGLGLNVTLDLFEEYIQPGDQILLIPEYGLLVNSTGMGELGPTISGAISRPTIGARTLEQMVEQVFSSGRPGLKAVAYTINQKFGLIQETRGYTALVNQHGDAKELPTSHYRAAPSWKADRSDFSNYSLQELQQFRQRVNARGGHMTISLPWLLAKDEVQTTNQLRRNLALLQTISPVVTHLKTLNATSDVSLFSDTAYHLSVKGRQARSEELVGQLKVLWSLP